MSCIFCSGTVDASCEEHVLPESLGGKEWACLPSGLVCAKCNQYFGAKVEAQALSSFPLLPFRLLLGIPTKKRKAPALETHLGMLRSGISPGTLGLDPANNSIERRVNGGEITQIRILAEPTEPLAVCRLLLKMGLEVLANDSPDAARSSKFDAARTFARSPQGNQQWWFLVACDHTRLFARFREGVSAAAWAKGVSLSISQEQGAAVFHLRLLDMSLITPLEPKFQPSDELRNNEPDWRLFEVSASTKSQA